MDAFRRILILLICFCLLFFAPILYFTLKMDVVEQTIVEQETTEFTNRVSEHGYLNLSSLNLFYQSLATTGNVYDIDIIHKKRNLEPEYRFKTSEEIIAQQNASYTGMNIYNYSEVLSVKPTVTDEMPSDLRLNTQTNENVLASSHDVGADPTHIHTPNCYLGHVHSGEPFVPVQHTHNAWCDRYIRYAYVKYRCPSCGLDTDELMLYQLYSDDNVLMVFHFYGRENRNIELGQTNITCKDCGHNIHVNSSDWTYIYDYKCGFNLMEYYGITNDWWNENANPLTNTNKFTGERIFKDVVEYGESHTYKFHDRAITQSYVHSYENGCYQFHKQSLPSNWVFNPSGEIRYQYYDSSSGWKSQPDWYGGLIRAYNYGTYCALPSDFFFGYTDNMYSNAYVNYQAQKQPDGSFLFRKTWETGSNDIYPDSLTVEELANAMDNTREALITYIPSLRTDWVFNHPENQWDNITRSCSGTYLLCDDGTGKCKTDAWYTLCGEDALGTCMCDEIIVSIVATNPNQTIYTGEELITTINITYLDGSRKTAIGMCSFNTNNIGMNQTVTISYDGKDSPTTTKRFTTTINVSVLSRTKVCANGHTYWLKEDGSDPGCPYCNQWLRNLELISPSSGYLEMIQDTTLEQNGVKVRATFLNGTSTILTTGYVHNLDNHYIGEQTVTIGYRGMYVTLKVRVNRKKRVCTICGKEYELYPDGSDPGCPYCLALIPVFTGNILTYYSEIPMSEIRKEIEEHGVYPMERGDEFTVHISNKTDTPSTKLLSILGYVRMKKIGVWDSVEIRGK